MRNLAKTKIVNFYARDFNEFKARAFVFAKFRKSPQGKFPLGNAKFGKTKTRAYELTRKSTCFCLCQISHFLREILPIDFREIWQRHFSKKRKKFFSRNFFEIPLFLAEFFKPFSAKVCFFKLFQTV